jgi:MEMO1 family protein
MNGNFKYWNPMKYRSSEIAAIVLFLLIISACRQQGLVESNIRPLVDTIGFAQYDWQMDSILARINRSQDLHTVMKESSDFSDAKVVISPHDDYSYVGNLYPAALEHIKAGTVILFGVAHKAKLMNLQDQLIFDSYKAWKGPFGPVKVSEIREAIIENLPTDIFQVNDSMQRMEHSVEAIIPFLQYFNRNVEIVSILVPYMSFDRMQEISVPLSKAIQKATVDKGMVWGKDFAIIISTDAVHYGDEDWGGKNFAIYGTDSAGYKQAIAHDHEIMDTLSGILTPQKVKEFCKFTVDDNDFKEYKWTWCGRYSVPMGLLTAYDLNRLLQNTPLTGKQVGYANSIDHPALEVKNLGMGFTAPASMHHWVGYAAIVYR